MKWEYLHEYFKNPYLIEENTTALQKHLNQRGQQGWELVSLHFGDSAHVDLVFKKPKANKKNGTV